MTTTSSRAQIDNERFRNGAVARTHEATVGKQAHGQGTRRSGATSSATDASRVSSTSTSTSTEMKLTNDTQQRVAAFLRLRQDLKQKAEATRATDGSRPSEGKAHHDDRGGANGPAEDAGRISYDLNCDPKNEKFLEITDDLGGIVGLPKPRTGLLDYDIWSDAKSKAKLEVFKQFEIPNNAYYSSMCKIGKKLMIETIRKKAQDIYDYRCGKMVYRRNRRKGHDQHVVANEN